MRLEKETSIYQLGAIAAGIGNAVSIAESKNSIFHQAEPPSTSGRKVGDIWYDSDDGYAMHKFDGTTWVREQYGTNAISAGSVTAARLNAEDVYTNFLRVYFLSAAQAEIEYLSAITANLGSVNVGGINNAAGVLTIKDASNNTIGTWNKDGINAIAGSIGGWNINAAQLSKTTVNVTEGSETVTYTAYLQGYNGTPGGGNSAFGIHRTVGSTTTMAFAVYYDGRIHAEKGDIGGWNIGSASLYYGTLGYANSIHLIPAGSTVSTTIAGRAGTDWVLTAGANFGLTKTGVMYASGGKFSGDITAGGANNVSGSITVQNSGGNTIGKWDKDGLLLASSQSGAYITFGMTSGGNRGYLEYDAFYNRFTAGQEIGWSIDSNEKAHVSVLSTSANTGSVIIEAYDASDYATGFTINPTDGIVAYNTGGFFTLLDANGNTSIPGTVTFTKAADVALLKNTYNGTTYNIIRNHNNGNISISASGSGLYLGYENTTNMNFLNGKATLSSGGAFNATLILSTVSNGEAQVVARNSETGNRIYLYATASSGNVGIYSFDSNNTGRAILVRANNSSDITAYGTWEFNTGVRPWLNTWSGKPIISDSPNGNRVAVLGTESTNKLVVMGQFNNTDGSYPVGTVTLSMSDIRMKSNIKDCNVSALPVINAIRMREFDWNDGRHQYIGVIADELQELDYNLAVGGGYTNDGAMKIKSVDTFYLVGYLVKAVQELSAEVNRLKGAA